MLELAPSRFLCPCKMCSSYHRLESNVTARCFPAVTSWRSIAVWRSVARYRRKWGPGSPAVNAVSDLLDSWSWLSHDHLLRLSRLPCWSFVIVRFLFLRLLFVQWKFWSLVFSPCSCCCRRQGSNVCSEEELSQASREGLGVLFERRRKQILRCPVVPLVKVALLTVCAFLYSGKKKREKYDNHLILNLSYNLGLQKYIRECERK